MFNFCREASVFGYKNALCGVNMVALQCVETVFYYILEAGFQFYVLFKGYITYLKCQFMYIFFASIHVLDS